MQSSKLFRWLFVALVCVIALPAAARAQSGTGDRPAVNNAFTSQLMDWYLHRGYQELDGPLTDAISKIRPS